MNFHSSLTEDGDDEPEVNLDEDRGKTSGNSPDGSDMDEDEYDSEVDAKLTTEESEEDLEDSEMELEHGRPCLPATRCQTHAPLDQ